MLGLHLRELALNNYRNYTRLGLKFNSNRILFIGKNAQGKTNILEAIFLACTGRSHRTSKDNELIRWGQKSCNLRMLVEKKIGINSIEIILSEKERKKIKINGIPVKRLGQLMGHLNGVIFSPEDLKIVKEGPSERRRFMDMEISQVKPKYFYYLQQYNRILNHRNNLLKEINNNPVLEKTLSVWNAQLAEAGAFIIKQRYEFVENLAEIAKEIHKRISFDVEELSIKYRASVLIKPPKLKDIETHFLEALEKCRDDDIRRGNTGIGCHRDDLNFEINGVDVRTFGSQGQQRTVALSLKLSELKLMYKETGEYPVLLLDDVMSELDEERQKQLFEELGDIQTFITATDFKGIPLAELRKFDIYEVKGGKVLKKPVHR